MTCRVYLNGQLMQFPIGPRDTGERRRRQEELNRKASQGIPFDHLFMWIPFHFGQYIAMLSETDSQGTSYATSVQTLNERKIFHCHGRWWVLPLGQFVYRVHDRGNPPQKPLRRDA